MTNNLEGSEIPIKLPLYAIDYDQTHDLIVVSNFNQAIRSWLHSIPHFVRFQDEDVGIVLIERFTVLEYPWCENYSQSLYNFFKLLSLTGDYLDPFRTGYLIDLEIDLGEMNLSFTGGVTLHQTPVIIENTTNQTQSITWLEDTYYEFDGESGTRFPVFDMPARAYTKRTRLLRPGKKAEINLRFTLLGSFVASDPSLLTDIPLQFHHSQLASFLQSLVDHLNQQYPRLNKYLTGIEYETEISQRVTANVPWQQTFDLNHDVVEDLISLNISGFTYGTIPDWHHFTSLVYGNNNYWRNGVEKLEDLGQPVDIKVTTGGLELKPWRFSPPVRRWNDNEDNYFANYLEGSLEGGGGSHLDPQILIVQQDTRQSDGVFFGAKVDVEDQSTISVVGTLPGLSFALSAPYNFVQELAYLTPYSHYTIDNHGAWSRSWDRTNRFLIKSESGYPIYWSTAVITGSDSWNINYSDVFTDDDNITVYRYRGTLSGEFNYSHFTAKGEFTLDRELKEVRGAILTSLTENLFTQSIFSDQSWWVQYQNDPPQSLTYPEGGIFTKNENRPWLPTSLVPGGGQVVDNIVSRTGGGDWRNTYQDTGTIVFSPWDSPPVFETSYTTPEGEIFLYLQNRTMPDSVRVKEIHAALEAGFYAWNPDEPETPRVANLGYYLERIARILGISVNPNGSIRSIRQSKFVRQGETIPAGWSIAQWGRNQGNNSQGQSGGNEDEDRDGLAYEVRSNRFEIDKFTGEATSIEEGGYVLVENLPQLLHLIMDDLDKALGLAAAGANALPSANGKDVLTYEGLNTLLCEVAYMLSAISEQVGQLSISSAVNQGISIEILGSLGLPTTVKEFEVDFGEEFGKGKIPYPGLAADSPTITNLLNWQNINLSLIQGGTMTPVEKLDGE